LNTHIIRSKQNRTRKTKISQSRVFVAVAFILVLTVPMFIVGIPAAFAQTKAKSYAYLSVDPSVVGVNTPILINSWTEPQPDMVPGTSVGQVRAGLYYDITKPDGTTTTIGPRNTDSFGSGTDYFLYTPDQTGQYRIKMRWGGDSEYLSSETPVTVFTVQTSSLPRYQEVSPPQGYWIRPISAQNRNWYSIGGSWIQATGRDTPCFNPYSEGPTSAHISWKIQTSNGGLIGGNSGSATVSASAPSKIIMLGKAYFSASDGIHCVDVHTGKELWTPAKTMGSGSMYGVAGPTPYIWFISSTAIQRFDALTGASSKNVTGFPTGASMINFTGQASWRQNRVWMDDNGIVYINIDDALERFVGTFAYNTSVSSSNFYGGVMWQLQRQSMNSTNVDLTYFPYGNATGVVQKTYQMPLQDLSNIAVDTVNGIVFHCANGGPYCAGIDAKTGELLWDVKSDTYFEGQGTVINGVGVIGSESDMKVYGFDLKTGRQLWVSEPNDYPWGAFRAYSAGAAYDKFYLLSYDGTVRAYNFSTGATVWKYYNGNDTTGESPYGTYPFYNNPAIAGGIIVAPTSEHTPTIPLKRGDGIYAIDTTTGKLLWKIEGCNSQLSIADGVLVASDSYMPMIYGFSKGQTATTVSASTKVVTLGSSALIEGTVMDLSPAQPNTPAISDESMSAWMMYLHMQQTKPNSITGVKVHLTATDPNGNYQDIGYTTSDALGNFALAWNPPVAGLYKVKATFEGSNSYYSSEAGTAFITTLQASVAPAATVAPTPTAAPTIAPTPTGPVVTPSPVVVPPTSAAPITTYIAIGIAVIVIIAAAAALVLRKRK
jgi:outer membrane protein assembly factor BamB